MICSLTEVPNPNFSGSHPKYWPNPSDPRKFPFSSQIVFNGRSHIFFIVDKLHVVLWYKISPRPKTGKSSTIILPLHDSSPLQEKAIYELFCQDNHRAWFWDERKNDSSRFWNYAKQNTIFLSLVSISLSYGVDQAVKSAIFWVPKSLFLTIIFYQKIKDKTYCLQRIGSHLVLL